MDGKPRLIAVLLHVMHENSGCTKRVPAINADVGWDRVRIDGWDFLAECGFVKCAMLG
jgi:hypothetical protein